MDKEVTENLLKAAKTASVGDMLDAIDNQLGRLSIRDSGNVADILKDLDQVKSRLDEGAAKGYDVRAETAQFDGVLASIRVDARMILRKMGGEEALRKARNAHNPPADHWWWYLDGMLAEEQRKTMARMARSAAIVVGVLIVFVVVYNQFFRPDPAVIAIMNARQNAEYALMEGNIDQALLEVNQGLEVAPESEELILLKAGILEAMGENEEAASLFAKAEVLIGDKELYTIAQGQVYLALGEPGKAIPHMLAMLEEFPESARGYLILGQAYEDSGDQMKALEAYEMASTTGTASDDPTIVAQARIKMAFLMQQYSLPTMQGEEVLTPAP